MKNKFITHINKIEVMQDGDSIVRFSNPVPITSDQTMYNGARYDIASMDISKYKGLVTVNHSDNIQDIVGKVMGVQKNDTNVTITGIEFATEHSALARFTRDMFLNGFITDFSIETVGPWADDDGVYYNSELIGLSIVLVGNNKEATVSEIYAKVLNSAKDSGLNVDVLNKIMLDNEDTETNNNHMKYVTIKNSKDFPVVVKYKNAEGDEVEKTLAPAETLDVSEEQKEVVETQVEEATAPETTEEPKEEKKEETEAKLQLDAVLNKIEKLEKEVLNKMAKEPNFIKDTSKQINSMDYKQRHAEQIVAAWDMLKNHDSIAASKLKEINKVHLESLQKDGIVSNSVTIADMGNFVISPELLRDIEGHRSNYQDLLSRVDWKETLSLQMAWLSRSGDISMTEVEHCDDGADGNLKPISEYGATINTSNLHELAAVTPVCDAATRFLAVDLLGDVANGYRTDYDRKRAQLLIARLQQAVNTTGNTVTYSTVSSLTAIQSFIDVWSSMAEEISNGIFVFNYKTYGQLLRQLVGAGISTDSAMGLFTTGNQPMILGRPYVVVPNDLMPTLNTAETKSFTVEGSSVTINKGVFYFDPTTFTGRTSGGLKYDLSTEAAYEDGETVKSAFQRNELVLRGSFFRGGAVKDTDKVVGLGANGVS
jgi:HK97 family phage major capsid protein